MSILILFFLICCSASGIGAICGIGGGVIIKPVLDAFQIMDVHAISFLSGTTVLSMTAYSVYKSKRSGVSRIDVHIGRPLAIGAIVGGLLGQSIFHYTLNTAANVNVVGVIQGVCMVFVTGGTLAYVLCKEQITTLRIDNFPVCLSIGLLLGLMSSFLGIGGGPINLVVLYFFFSMETKMAAENSLYIIFFSQSASLLQTIVTGSWPDITPMLLAFMIAGGLSGGWWGRRLNRQMEAMTVDKLFIALLVVIIGISFYDIYKFVEV